MKNIIIFVCFAFFHFLYLIPNRLKSIREFVQLL
jgi:hypothetical protein